MIDEILSKGRFPSVLLVFGEEEYLVDDACRKLFDAAVALDTTGMNSDMVDGDGSSLDAVLTLARSFPMMSEKRIVWVRRFEKISGAKDKKGNDIMATYLKDPPASTFLLLSASYPSLDGISASLQKNAATAQRKIKSQKAPIGALLASATWIEFPRMREMQVRTWVRRRAESQGMSIDDAAIDFLVARTGHGLRELDMELHKLQTYAGDRTAITMDDVTDVVGAARAWNIFELQKAIAKVDAASAMTILTKMMEAERQEMFIITMLSRYFLSLYALIDARSSSDRNEMAKAAGMPPFAVPDALEALDRLGPARVERALYAIQRADATIKSASTETVIVLQQMLADILDVEARR